LTYSLEVGMADLIENVMLRTSFKTDSHTKAQEFFYRIVSAFEKFENRLHPHPRYVLSLYKTRDRVLLEFYPLLSDRRLTPVKSSYEALLAWLRLAW